MTLKYFLVLLLAHSVLGFDFPSADKYLLAIQKLIPSFNANYLFDGPPSVSSAPITTSVKITKPTRREMMYYNYYAASINSAFGVKTMECYYCAKIIGDIKHYDILDNSTHDTSVIVAVSEKRKEIVVAYRATLNLWNWVLDAYSVQMNVVGADQIKLHRGFFIATMSLYDRVVKAIAVYRLRKKEYAAYKLVLTGHSLGAAMARITEFLLIHLKQFPRMPIEVYTYGEPRGGNKHYVDFLNKQNVKTARITNRADIVSHVIPTFMSGSIGDYYYHVSNEYWLNGNKEKFCDRSIYEDPSCGNSYGPYYSGVDHLMFFDVNHVRTMSDIHEMLAVPVVFNPTDVLPPLPKAVQIAVGDISEAITRNYTTLRG